MTKIPTRDEQKELRRHFRNWPVRPFLPLYHAATGDLAIIVEGQGNTIFHCLYPDALMVLFLTDGIHSSEFREWLHEHETDKFRSFDAVLDAGWLID